MITQCASAVRRKHRTEDGTVLIMTLIFLTVVGVIAVALASGQVGINRASFSTRKTQLRETGTNSGLEWAVNSLRQGADGFCQGTYTSQILSIGGREVRVTCKGSGSATPGTTSWALYLNNSGPAGQNQAETRGAVGASTVKNIEGPVYNAGGWDLKAPMEVKGDVLIPAGTAGCSGSPSTAPIPSNLRPLYNTVLCSTTALSEVTPAAIPAPPSPTPAAVLLDAAGNVTTGVPSCKVFSPGTYTAPPALAGSNYFKPGVYYFEFGNTWSLNSAVRAGDPNPAPANSSVEPVLTSVPKCPGAPAATSPFGVVFVFGKGAALNVRNNGRIELFGYDNGTLTLPNIVAAGTNSTLAAVIPWAAKSTVPTSQDLVFVGVAQPEFVMHSGFFAPDSGFTLKGSNDALEIIRNTVVVARVTLQASASIGAFGIKVPAGATKKYVLLADSCPGVLSGLTANACSVPPSSGELEPRLCSVASLVIYNDSKRTPYLDNWRVDRDPGTDLGISDRASCDANYVVP